MKCSLEAVCIFLVFDLHATEKQHWYVKKKSATSYESGPRFFGHFGNVADKKYADAKRPEYCNHLNHPH